MKFSPTIYEYNSMLCNTTISDVAQSEDKLFYAQMKAFELFKPDIMTIGVDVYNIEVEALGAKIHFFKDNSLPEMKENIISDIKEVPDFIKNIDLESLTGLGRIPMFLNVAKKIRNALPKDIEVLCAVTGPFTLAVLLRGYENIIYDIIIDKENVLKLLDFTTAVSQKIAMSYLKYGVQICLNESYICPPLLSPKMFKDLVFPYEKRLINYLHKHRANTVSLVSGGNTETIFQMLIKTNSDLLMADNNCNIDNIMKISSNSNVRIRGNINNSDLLNGEFNKIQNDLQNLFQSLNINNNNLIGCGIIAKDTPINNILKFKSLFNEYNSKTI